MNVSGEQRDSRTAARVQTLRSGAGRRTNCSILMLFRLVTKGHLLDMLGFVIANSHQVAIQV